ncbi:helix-turn-helix domain containing protein [Paenibacillus larvae]|nr:helix-turn-helix domain-containing protein [Paenibacillus larvae]MDT2258480.1 helix-turn-helix domain containing protein [Paenibacillus larvae]
MLLLAYHATSIQEIVDTAGIAKGSLYFYFKSKEDLLLSLLKYYYDLLRSTINIISQDTHLSSRERLAKQMLAQFEFLTENKDFIMMLMHESSLYSNETFRQFGLWVQFPIRSMVLPKNCGYLWGRNKALWGRYGIYSECCDPAVFLVQYDF